jgi:LysR family glycine cleavage system transcriptional activator
MQNLNRVHLNGLRAVEAVGRLGSLRAAAEELGVSTGAVSQQVIKCEERLGSPVFDRTSRGVVPTPFGQELLGRLTAGFRTLDEAIALSQRHADTVLTISVAPVFASRWLVPRLTRYSQLHPEIQVRLDASVTLVNPDASDIDIAIRVGDGNWPGVRKDFLLPQEVFPVSAPELAARLKEPRDILSLPIVRDANSTISWDVWLAPFGLSESDLTEGHTFTDASLCLDAVIAGQGVMLAWQTLAQYALSVGQVVAPFRERAATGLGYWLVTSATRREPKKIRDFKDWIQQEIAETARLFET